MMNKKQSSKMHIGKYVCTLAAAVIGSLIFGVSNAYDNSGISTIQEVSLSASQDTLKLKERKHEPLYIIDGEKQTGDNKRNLNPKDIKAMSVFKGEKAIERYGEEGKKGVIEVVTHLENNLNIKVDTQLELDKAIDIRVNTNLNENVNIKSVQGTGSGEVESKDASVDLSGEIGKDVLIFVDGKEIPHDQMENISPSHIKSISVYKGVDAEEHFGKKGKEGVIEIFLKGDKP